MVRQILWLLIAFPLSIQIACGETATTTDKLCLAIEKAIPMIEKGMIGSADQRECFTCHSQAVPVFAIVAAKARGYTIDEANLQRQLNHTYDHLQRGVKNYREGKGQGGGVLTAGYAMWALDEGDFRPDETTEAVIHYLVSVQKDRPSWQHKGTRPPSSGSDFTATYVALRALDQFGIKEQADRIAERREAVAKWLFEAHPDETEDLVFQLRALPYLRENTIRIAEVAQELLEGQRDDGGWGQKTEMESDAYATGSVLVALIEDGNIAIIHPAIQNGIAYLIKTQLEDGTWHVKTRAKPFQEYFESGFPHGDDQFISIAATAWSTLALLSVAR